MDKSISSLINPSGNQLPVDAMAAYADNAKWEILPTNLPGVAAMLEGGLKQGEMFIFGAIVPHVSPGNCKSDMIGYLYSQAKVREGEIEKAFKAQNPNASEEDIRKHLVANLPNEDKGFINVGIQRYMRVLLNSVEFSYPDNHDEIMADLRKQYYKPEDFKASTK